MATKTNYPKISVEAGDGDLYYASNVNQALDHINGKPVGKALLEAIAGASPAHSAGEANVVIFSPANREFTQSGYSHPMFGQMVGEGKVGAMTPRGAADNYNDPDNRPAAEGGGGSSCRVRWNSTIHPPAAGGMLPPAFICLAHELVHSMHALEGTTRTGDSPDGPTEELYTVGLGEFADEAICENTIRGEHGFDPRPSYP